MNERKKKERKKVRYVNQGMKGMKKGRKEGIFTAVMKEGRILRKEGRKDIKGGRILRTKGY